MHFKNASTHISKRSFCLKCRPIAGVKVEIDFTSSTDGEHKETQFTAINISAGNAPEEIQIHPDFENIRKSN